MATKLNGRRQAPPATGRGKGGAKASPPKRRKAAPVPLAAPQAPPAAAERAPGAQPGPALPPEQTLFQQQLQFAIGMGTNSAHHMRVSGLPPAVVVSAFLRVSGMLLEAFNVTGADIAGEIEAGRVQQAQFMASQQPRPQA